MPSVFKFAKRQYVELAVNEGRFRFSSASSFRDSAEHDDGRSDPHELVSRATVLDGEETLPSTDPRFGGMFVHRRAGEIVPMEMTISGGRFHLIDSGMLFCTSLDNSAALFNNMSEKFGADAAYEIVDVDQFVGLIESQILDSGEYLDDFVSPNPQNYESLSPEFAAAMRRKDDWARDQRAASFRVQHGPVRYVDRTVARSVGEMTHDTFEKALSYDWQQEYRVLISAFEGKPYHDIVLPSLAELVRRVR